ncbi:MAG TPA: hypothetical protein VJO16_11085 [Candidatus Acidoferrum sp.]|nr:hypothetical protein [Candidatus Acidoferrum sp.]
MRRTFRVLASFLVALCVALPASPIQTPLSDESVRDAYFLGQRHDGTYPSILTKYIKIPPPPKSGPYISSVTLKTPFIQLLEYSDAFIGNYSAQKALLDHHGKEEFALVFVEIQLTDSYGRLVPPPPNWLSRSPEAWVPRPSDFWRDFQVQIYNGEQPLAPYDFHGHATYGCGRGGHPCILTGATLELDFRAESFTSDSAVIQVIPPEGDPVSVDFDLIRLR